MRYETIFFSALAVLSSRIMFALYSISLGIPEAFLVVNSVGRDAHTDSLYYTPNVSAQDKYVTYDFSARRFMLGLVNSLRLNRIKYLGGWLHDWFMHDWAVVPSGLYWLTHVHLRYPVLLARTTTLLPVKEFRDGFCAMHCWIWCTSIWTVFTVTGFTAGDMLTALVTSEILLLKPLKNVPQPMFLQG